MPAESAPPAHGNQAVDRALSVLWILREHPNSSVTRVAEELGVHKSTASRLLAALLKQRLVDRAEDRGTYSLGFGLIQLAAGVTQRVDFSQAAQLLCERTARELGLTANVAILDEHHAVNVSQVVGGHGIMAPRHYVGLRTPGHATSSGKVLLAHASPATVKALIEAGLAAHTQRTIPDAARLRAELSAVAARGWAASDEEWEEGVTAVGVALRGLGPEAPVEAALTVTGPVHDLPPRRFEEIAARLGSLATASGLWR